MQDFDEYIRQTEPTKHDKGAIWKTAIGLQKTDGLETSSYLLEVARQNVDGDISIDEVKYRIDSYYKVQDRRDSTLGDRTEEADKVSARIAEILSEQSFSFNPAEYINIHGRLFADIYPFAGKLRDYNITKKEWVLDGATVLYAGSDSIKDSLEYDFNKEKEFNYRDISQRQIVEHLAQFIADLWQIHPFGEGNTRTTAVFLVKYLHRLGFSHINNVPFVEHSWYFRNALVRANYEHIINGIHADNQYLIRFFENLLFGGENALRNRDMHIGYHDDTVNKPFDTVFTLIQANPEITADEISQKSGLSIATVKRRIKQLKDLNKIRLVGSDKTGCWEVV